MAHLHIIGGEKGGVGKSVVARLLAQYFIDHDTAFKVYDADLSHGAMLRYYADFSEQVDISRFDNADRIVETIIESAETALLDLAAQSSRALYRWISETGLLEIADELGLKITLWHVMDDGKDAVKLLDELFELYGKQVDYVIVKNYGRGNDFKHLKHTALTEKIHSLDATTIDLPALHQPTMHKIDHISASFWAAANNTDTAAGPTLGLLERQRVRIWLKKAYDQFNQINFA